MKSFNFLIVAVIVTGISFFIGNLAYEHLSEVYRWSETSAWPIALYLLLVGIFAMSLFIVPKWDKYGFIFLMFIVALWIIGLIIGLK